MSSRRFPVATLAVAANAFAAPALAGVLFSQAPDPAGGQIKSAWYAPDGMDGDMWAWDNFSLAGTQSINQVSWRGAYANANSGAGRAPVYDFTVAIYPSSIANEPDIIHPPLVTYQTAGNANETVVGTFGGLQMYDYSFTLPAAFTAQANTTYWVEIYAWQGLTPQYYWPPDWSIAYAAPGTGNGSHFQAINGSTRAGPRGTTYHWYPRDLAFSLASVVPVVNATWKNDESGNWSSGGMWNNGVAPNGTDHTATLGPVITAPRTVTTTSAVSVGTIHFNSPISYTVSGAGTITLDATTQAGINVPNGSHTISAPLKLISDATINVEQFSSTLTIGATFVADGRTITKLGSGALDVANVRAGGLTVLDGFVNVRANGTASGASRIGVLDISPFAWMDVNDNDVVLTATPLATVESLVASGRAGGTWWGTGLTSSNAANKAETGLGVVSGADFLALGNASFDGFAVAPTDVLVKYTWNGDANLDGRVTFDDYVKIDTGFNQQLRGWLNGDFNYDGSITFDDYVLIDVAFNQQNGTLSRVIDWISGDDRSTAGLDQAGVGEVIAHFGQFGTSYGIAFLAAIPEPGTAVTVTVAGAAAAAAAAMKRHRARGRAGEMVSSMSPS